MTSETKYILMGVVILAVIAVILVNVPGDAAHKEIALNKLTIAAGFTLLALVFLYGLAVLIYIANGKINLSDLLSETNDTKASMSRFQLLIFTLVIALSLFLVVVSKMEFPKIPPEVLTLLGISASTYAVSKGIQVSGETPPPPPAPPDPQKDK